MASRDTEKMKFPMVDILRKEQEEKKNISVEKDDFSEVVQEDSLKHHSPKIYFLNNTNRTGSKNTDQTFADGPNHLLSDHHSGP